MVRNQSGTRLYFLALKINSLLDEGIYAPDIHFILHGIETSPPDYCDPVVQLSLDLPGYLSPALHLAVLSLATLDQASTWPRQSSQGGIIDQILSHSCTKSLGMCALHVLFFFSFLKYSVPMTRILAGLLPVLFRSEWSVTGMLL